MAPPVGISDPLYTDPAYDPAGRRNMHKDDPTFEKRFYVNPEPSTPQMPALSGPNSIAHKIMPPKMVVKQMGRLRHDEMPSWNGIAALRNLVDDTQPEVQQDVVDAGAAEAIIATMQAWPDHAGIQVSGCGSLVKVAEVDANARKRVLEAGAIFELAAAIERLAKHSDTDGEMMGKHIVHKSNFARDCLLKVAGKKTDPRNKTHIQKALDGGVDPKLFVKLDPKAREKMEQEARANFLKLKEKEEEKQDEEEAALLAKTPWAQTMERDREVCVLFPGQGTQKKGMADKLMLKPEAKALFDKASEILGYDLAALIRDGPQDKLDQTLYSQPAVFVTSLAQVEVSKKARFETLGRSKMCAGFSLGEYTALVYANVMSFEDGLKLVKARAEAMDAAAKNANASMASISGVDDPTLLQLIGQATAEFGGDKKAYIANYMFPEGRTCSGDVQVLKKLCELVQGMGQGKSGKMVNVSGAFHTPYMQPAAEALAKKIDETPMEMPTLNVVSNVTGVYFYSVEEIRTLLKRQLVEPVRWEQSMEEVTKPFHFHTAYIETGPGKQLKAMMRRIDQEAWGKMTVLED